MKGLVKDVIWLLRRMKQLNVDERTITNYWKADGRVHLETCAPVWTGGLTVGQARQIQRVLRRAVAAIMGGSREGYTASCSRLGLEPGGSASAVSLPNRWQPNPVTRTQDF